MAGGDEHDVFCREYADEWAKWAWTGWTTARGCGAHTTLWVLLMALEGVPIRATGVTDTDTETATEVLVVLLGLGAGGSCC